MYTRYFFIIIKFRQSFKKKTIADLKLLSIYTSSLMTPVELTKLFIAVHFLACEGN